jgi:hypothetical protein
MVSDHTETDVGNDVESQGLGETSGSSAQSSYASFLPKMGWRVIDSAWVFSLHTINQHWISLFAVLPYLETRSTSAQ